MTQQTTSKFAVKKIRPGFLVMISTSVKGGVKYDKVDLEHKTEGAADVASWQTERRIEDLAEYNAAQTARDRARTLITGACYRTPFGQICPSDQVRDFFEVEFREDQDGPWDGRKMKLRKVPGEDGGHWTLDVADGRVRVDPQDGRPRHGEPITLLPADGDAAFVADVTDISLNRRISEATKLVDDHNAGATHTKVRVSTLRGEIAKDDQEAVEAVVGEIKELLGDLDESIAKGDVKAIRDLASRARTMGMLLEQQENAEGALGRAVKAARTIARVIAKKVDNGTEELAAVLEKANTDAIVRARFLFGDDDIEQPDDDEGGEALPAFVPQRFAGLEQDEDDEDQPNQDQAGGLFAGLEQDQED